MQAKRFDDNRLSSVKAQIGRKILAWSDLERPRHARPGRSGRHLAAALGAFAAGFDAAVHITDARAVIRALREDFGTGAADLKPPREKNGRTNDAPPPSERLHRIEIDLGFLSVHSGGAPYFAATAPSNPGARPNASQAAYFGLPPSQDFILCLEGRERFNPFGSLPEINIREKSFANLDARL